MLMPMGGFLMDTTLAAAHLVYAGIPARFPNTTWALGHLGGAVPYLAERFDRGYEAFSHSRDRLSRPPSEVLKEFYYDTVNFDPACLRLAIEFAGADEPGDESARAAQLQRQYRVTFQRAASSTLVSVLWVVRQTSWTRTQRPARHSNSSNSTHLREESPHR